MVTACPVNIFMNLMNTWVCKIGCLCSNKKDTFNKFYMIKKYRGQFSHLILSSNFFSVGYKLQRLTLGLKHNKSKYEEQAIE